MLSGDGDGSLTPRMALVLYEGLPQGCMTHASMQGDMEYLGWDEDRMILAETFNAIRDLTVVSGNWKKKAPKFDRWPMPAERIKKRKKKKDKPSVKDLFHRFRGSVG